MTVRISTWRAERTHPNTFRLWRGNAIAGHIVTRLGVGGWAWYAKPAFVGRKGQRIGRPTPAMAARSYFGKAAAAAVEDAEASVTC